MPSARTSRNGEGLEALLSSLWSAGTVPQSVNRRGPYAAWAPMVTFLPFLSRKNASVHSTGRQAESSAGALRCRFSSMTGRAAAQNRGMSSFATNRLRSSLS